MTGKKITSLIEAAGNAVVPVRNTDGAAVTSIEYDSRRVIPGSLFAAVKGFAGDGFEYIGSAVQKGAAAVLVDRGRVRDLGGLVNGKTAVLACDDTRIALSALSDAFFGHPSKSMRVIGVTGTNGKTSITYMLESVYRLAGKRVGVIGTVNYRWGGRLVGAPNTTPESRDLQEMLAAMRNDGTDTVIMEVSSHALKLHRADHVRFDAGIFTNLTRDHLDFHGDFDDYFASKLRLFDLLETGGKEHPRGIVNGDDGYGARILSRRDAYGYPLLSFGVGAGDYSVDAESVVNRITGLGYAVGIPGGERVRLQLKLSGTFQLYNSLAAFAAAHSLGLPSDTIRRGLEDLATVPGRFDVVHSDEGFSVVVDYAHTSDALLKLLQSVRQLGPARLITVFGCGGDRDRTKRPIMGGIAEELSDICYVTSDNPRTEDPAGIIRDILAGMKGRGNRVVPDRAAAIREAVMAAGKGDIVVIAGKGHEDYQILGTTKIHFDDRELARQYIRERGGR
ncbi:MAG: UDP-N-acetylmuramoyl-L-alanyl-D-glutamate--2,6-diaminopimelate ligase [Spirochaetes bacterium]|nr:UDP-N-acetylmuramoyl-L-alanyl-D-glutamate--2,6-diaminopimelate ligase [Spirochaetota bacterium]